MSVTEEHATFCRLCEVMCGLTATVEDGRLVKVRGDADHPVSKGFACNKGLLAVDVHHDPDRLDTPQRRGRDGWESLSWPDAFDDIAERLRGVIAEHGPESVAVYLGNPNAFNASAGPAASMFLLGLGSGRLFSAGTQDCSNKFTIGEILYGSASLHPTPDLANTDYFLMIGSNPRVSKGSFMAVPDPVAAIRGVTERGGRVVFVNPVAIEPDIGPTLQVKPDTDAYFLAALLHEIDSTVGFDDAALGAHADNIDALRSFVAAYPPERVAAVVGIDAETIRAIAHDFATAPAAAIHTSTGVNMGQQGALAYYLQQMLSLVTGNLDRRGGNYVPARAIGARPAMADGSRDSLESTPWGDVRRSSSMLPAALLADWIRSDVTPIKALISVAGNPALSLGNSTDLSDALGELDLLVSIDLFRNATGELAHFNLPAADWFERRDLAIFTQGMQLEPHIQFTDAVVEPKGDRMPEWQMFTHLSAAMGLDPVFPLDSDALAMMNDAELATVGLSLAGLATRDRGLAVLDNDTVGTFFDDQILTPDRRIDCAPELIVESFERASVIFDQLAAEPPDQLKLITRRTRNTLNSALQNVERLKQRGAADNPLFLNPDDAASRGLAEGDLVTIATNFGKITAAVGFDASLRSGVAAMTHGFGNADTTGMSVAQRYPGVNVNELTPGGPGSFDPLSGMTQLTGLAITVT